MVNKKHQDIARAFPTLKLSTLLAAEEQFAAADTGGDEFIGAEELEEMLFKAISGCCPLRPHTTPFPEEKSILGVI